MRRGDAGGPADRCRRTLDGSLLAVEGLGCVSRLEPRFALTTS